MKNIIFILSCFIILFPGCTDKNRTTDSAVILEEIGYKLKYDPNQPVNNGNKISIVFWTQVDFEDVYSELIADYTAIHPNVSIDLVPSAFSDHFNKLKIAVASGIGPDIFHIHNSFTDDLIPHMAPYPSDVLPYEILIEEFRQVPLHITNGDIYFIDTGLMTGCIFYNKKIWQESGLTEMDFPETWEELLLLARSLTVYDENGEIIRSGFNPNGQGFALYTAMNIQKGQRMFSEVDLKSPILNQPASKETIEFLSLFYEIDGVVDVNFPLFHESFGGETSAMIYSWGWTINWLSKYFPDISFGTFPTPVWNDYPLPVLVDRNNGESSMGLNKYISKEKQEVAFDLIKFFLSSDKYLLELNMQFGLVPSKRKLEENQLFIENEYFQAFFSIKDETFWPGIYPDLYESNINEYLIDPVLIDNKSINIAFEELENILLPQMRLSSFISLEK